LLLCVCRYLHATTLKVLFLHSGAVIFLRVVESIDLDTEAPFSIKGFLREKEAHLWDVKLLLVFSGLLITCCCQRACVTGVNVIKGLRSSQETTFQ